MQQAMLHCEGMIVNSMVRNDAHFLKKKKKEKNKKRNKETKMCVRHVDKMAELTFEKSLKSCQFDSLFRIEVRE
jgi:hypothetical protein